MMFLAILIVNIILGYIVFDDQYRKKPIFNYDTCIESFGTTAFSVILYFLISSICLIFLLERIDIYVVKCTGFFYKEEIINSGLSFTIGLVLTGYLIRALYGCIYCLVNKLGEKHNKKYMAEMNENEKTLIIIVSCISLITVTITKEKDYELVFFIIALILGKFFWIDSSFKDVFSNIRKWKPGVFVTIILFWIVCVYLSDIFDAVLYNLIGIPVGFILGMIICIVIKRKKDNR